jgi:membrane protein YdbS with pleckstrin-like domain
MIPLNTRQGLPANAFWYVALRSLLAAVFLIVIARLFQFAPPGSCRGLLCPLVPSGFASYVIFLFAFYLVASAILRFKFFWFVLTDKNISINSGILLRRSCTIRFDRIQDVDTIRGLLHMMLGLTTVAIWTASFDQRRGKSNRPDGLIVLDMQTAEWLRQYLSDPPQSATAAPGQSRGGSPVSVGDVPSLGKTGLVLTSVVVVLAIIGLVGFWRLTASMGSSAGTAGVTPAVVVPSTAAPPAVASNGAPGVAPGARASSHPHLARTAVAPAPAGDQAIAPLAATNQAAQYGLACTIDKTLDGVKPCGDLKQAGRCDHEGDFRSQPTDEPAVLTVANRSNQTVKFYWLDRAGARSLYATLSPGGHVNQPSHIGAHWLVSTADDRCIGIFSATTMAVGFF